MSIKSSGTLLGLCAVIVSLFMILRPVPCNCAQWINPSLLVKDPATVRLQQGRTALTEREKQDINKYGYTGLELMTYADSNMRPDTSWDRFVRAVIVSPGGHIKYFEWLNKDKYYYKNFLSLLNYDGIRPGDVMKKFAGIYLEPPERRYRGYVYYMYLTSMEKHQKDKEGWAWIHSLRRYRRSPTTPKTDHWLASVLTYDDYLLRRPWEEKHIIIGRDNYKGNECLIVESRNILDPDYYLSKRLSWVEEKNYLILHEEQFALNRGVCLITDKSWDQVKPGNYWVITEWNSVNPVTGERIVLMYSDFGLNLGLKDGEFLPAYMGKEHIWKRPEKSLPPIKNVSELPPVPAINVEFRDKLERDDYR